MRAKDKGQRHEEVGIRPEFNGMHVYRGVGLPIRILSIPTRAALQVHGRLIR